MIAEWFAERGNGGREVEAGGVSDTFGTLVGVNAFLRMLSCLDCPPAPVNVATAAIT